MRIRIAAVFAATLSVACAGSSPPPPEPGPAEPRETTCLQGRYEVRYEPVPDPIPFNEPFGLRVWVADANDGSSLPGAQVSVIGWMPDHGHGMNQHPKVTALGDGSHRVDGMLFHMRGHWDLYVDVVNDGIASRAVFGVEL